MEETLALAEEEGKVETLYGRVRWLPDIKSKNWNLRGELPPHGHQRPHPRHRRRLYSRRP